MTTIDASVLLPFSDLEPPLPASVAHLQEIRVHSFIHAVRRTGTGRATTGA